MYSFCIVVIEIGGIDLSQESIRLAKETYPNIEFAFGDMHQLEFEDSSFDFVYSSLTIHYSSKPGNVYKELFRILKPGGAVQFSVVHPIRWASERVELEGVSTKILGYSEDEGKRELYGTYSFFKEYDDTFKSGEVLRFWVAPPSTHFSLLRYAGFTVDAFVETSAIEECQEVDEYYFIRNHEFPQFSVFVATKL